MPFGVYVHVPFCHSKCGYCAFATTTLNSRTAHEVTAFPNRLCTEIQHLLLNPAISARISTEPVTSLYFGGGTPSLLTSKQLEFIISGIRAQLVFAKDIEITLEVNPEGITMSDLASWRRVGVSRISIGMQSIRPRVLSLLDRHHNPRDALQVAKWAQKVGIEHVNIDLIYGTPGERPDDVLATLDAVVATPVDHVSAYALSIESGTALHRRVQTGVLAAPNADLAAERYELIDNYLSQHGFKWYEISSWARSLEAQSRHNLTYWLTNDWIGFGPSAHSRLGRLRFSTERNATRWADLIDTCTSTITEREVLDSREDFHEQLITRVRLHAGFVLQGPDAAPIREHLCLAGLVEPIPSSRISAAIRLSRSGRLLADRVVDALWDADVHISSVAEYSAKDYSTVVMPVV